jgi:hypothetical protein
MPRLISARIAGSRASWLPTSTSDLLARQQVALQGLGTAREGLRVAQPLDEA